MIATDITDASFPHTSEMLKTASQLGIKYFRWKGFEYDYAKPLEPQLKNLRPAVAELAAMAKEYGINGLYHAHSGEKKVGANFFDLWYLLDGIDPKALAWNLDTGHVTAEGGRGAWRNSIGILENRIRGLAVKDFVWEKDSKGKWDTRWCELGKGMVRFPEILELVAKTGFDGPVSMHFEQPELGKAKEGTSENDIPRDRFLAIFQRDLPVFRSMMKSAGLG
jgi:sugar phosphate isomerase/epimerase